jgi:hypothetical protein
VSLKDVAELVHFRELHLLPRTIFSIGAVCFIGAFFIKVFLVGFLGVGLIFVALTLNFAISVLLQTDVYLAKKTFTIPWTPLLQFVLCSVVTYELLVLVYYFYRHGEMPPYLKPFPPPR